MKLVLNKLAQVIRGDVVMAEAAKQALELERIVQMMLACRLFGAEPTTIPADTIDLVKSLGAL